MDFILSLTHFCEVHGPTSILCSQILPAHCRQCTPDSPSSSPNGSPSSSSSSSAGSLHVRDRDAPGAASAAAADVLTSSSSPSSDRCITTSAIEPLATPPASAPVTAPRIEDHPWFTAERPVRAANNGSYSNGNASNSGTGGAVGGGGGGGAGHLKKAAAAAARFGGAAGDRDTCASCRLKLPEDVSKQLPVDGNGSVEERGLHSSPVLRSREVVFACRGSHADHYMHNSSSSNSNNSNNGHSNYYDDDDDDGSHTCSTSVSSSHHHHHHHHHHGGSSSNNYYSPVSVHSSYSSSDSSCHTHVVTYLSMRGPANPEDYALLRRASIRTLSCELLPRGLSSGPLSFGDQSAGYTIAYVFRLPDPMARGKRRSYALVALAGKDAGRTFRASPLIWRTFGRIANNIVSAAEKFQESEKIREYGPSPVHSSSSTTTTTSSATASTTISARAYTPISSFLTGRALDPDGLPRRAGQVRARNLIEIVGNEYIFAELHAQFVALLQQLSAMFASPSDNAHGAHMPDSASAYYEDYANTTSTTSSRSSSDRLRGGSGSTGITSAGSDHSLSQQFSGLNMSTSIPKPIPISQRRRMVA
ncbi:TPA_exp: Uncharacterized protein A8136_2119 [Trichophyton benhamiae CBS 112371]|uniref:UDENN FLCN/SMCR8-type domain-containing protein n=1 Tax=Arthroderma benhamiae (strain ATCC MYA-4681 / CBS 112371) TaxID=663331 RepID=D4AY91_ARTBC|nr:uncharacterized protein ARB_01160 [Trichophyton benhamiae CBS 112371]EFE31907.1 conserved hypothetical protein [Trichophyton benhamiae CBS 112371]DAA75021.1 TPA_exp: Uncharacterized protein A8136_2119 [Trichophyton benhamiae CBS 112371]